MAMPSGSNRADELREALRAKIARDEELDLPTFQTLLGELVPGMEAHESRALFVSMDTSKDGFVQSSELFSDFAMAALASRSGRLASHPLEGSYYCLPNPPFKPDERQFQAVQELRGVYDGVLAAAAKPRPMPADAAPRAAPRAAPGAAPARGLLSWALGKGTPQDPKPRKEPRVAAWARAPKGAYLYGGTGCGKTVLLDVFFRTLPERVPARRLHYDEFLRDAFRAMHGHPRGTDVFRAVADQLSASFRVLLLDELAITHISEAILVKSLFRHMWARGMTILVTSNYRPEELYAKGFNRDQFEDFIPDLQAQCPIIDFKAEVDYRKGQVSERAGTFFCPISADTTACMDQAFREMVVGEVQENGALPIPSERRNVSVPAHGKDVHDSSVARFSFEDLCVGNLGRADYGVVAESFRTVFVHNVPKFNADLGMEFRRFVSFIDIMYSKKVILYLQSEVPVGLIFSDGLACEDTPLDDLCAFRRCSSRLSEMRNPQYRHMVWLMRNHMLQDSALRL